MREAVFLDRDGTLNFDPGYIGDPAKLSLLPGALEALQLLSENELLLIVVSNQSGVGRGFFSEDDLRAVHERLDAMVAGVGVKFTSYELCLHTPTDQCECRKPSPKLVLDAATRFGIDLSKSYMVGDKLSDVECGERAGVRLSYLIQAGRLSRTPSQTQSPRVKVVESLLQAATEIVGLKHPAK